MLVKLFAIAIAVLFAVQTALCVPATNAEATAPSTDPLTSRWNVQPWYDENVAWTGNCPDHRQDGEWHQNTPILWTDYATNGHLACGRRHPDARYNDGYFVGIDAGYGEWHCGQTVKLKVWGHQDRCAVVIETGARDGGLLLSPRFFREYQDLSNGQFQGTWNFVQ